MRPYVLSSFLVLVLVLVLVPVGAVAQTRFEVTPFVGLRTGGSFRALEQDLALGVQSSLGGGLMFDVALSEAMQAEFVWSRQSSQLEVKDVSAMPQDASMTELDEALPLFPVTADYFHGAFVYGGGPEFFRAYVLLGVGVSRLNVDVPDTSTVNRFSFSVGTGFKSFFSDRFGLRIDARAFGTRAGDREEDVACGVFGCVRFERAATFWQGQIVAGLMVTF